MRMPQRVLALASLVAGAFAAGAGATETLYFEARLGDKPVGGHEYTLAPTEDGLRVVSEARYKVNFLFFTAYEYHHRAEELWRDGCLVSLDARTDDNGEITEVSGATRDGALSLTVNGKQKTLNEACPRTFAYWNRELLATDSLLNPQTGELEKADLEPVGSQSLPWSDDRARAFDLKVPESTIRLWYEDERWLGLRSPVGDDRVMYYQRAEPEAGEGAP